MVNAIFFGVLCAAGAGVVWTVAHVMGWSAGWDAALDEIFDEMAELADDLYAARVYGAGLAGDECGCAQGERTGDEAPAPAPDAVDEDPWLVMYAQPSGGH